MANIDPEIKDDPKAERKLPREQYPVDAYIRKVWLDAGNTLGDVVRIVVMSGLNTAQNAAYKEYNHNDPRLSIEDVSSFVLRSATLASSQQAIDGFVGSMPRQLVVPQIATWSRGVHSPTSARSRLYKAPDPDDTTKMIGVLIEQDAQGKLTQLTWYKTRDASVLFQTTPEALAFEIVKNAAGAPSTDPNDIGGWTWYFTTSFHVSP